MRKYNNENHDAVMCIYCCSFRRVDRLVLYVSACTLILSHEDMNLLRSHDNASISPVYTAA